LSKFEKEFEDFFNEKKLKFIKNDRLNKGTPDFSFKVGKSTLVLFLHGCYWHGHNCKEWKLNNINLSKQAVTMRNDIEIRRYFLKKEGFFYLRCWECEFNKSKDYYLNKIYNIIINF